MKDRKKIYALISTLPLTTGNYGGILQAYALQNSLSKIGIVTSTITPTVRKKIHIKIISHLRHRIVNLWEGKCFIDEKIRKIYNANIDRFVSENINTTILLKNSKPFYPKDVLRFDCYIVGSDQVWREHYNNIPNQFFDYLKDTNLTRISYAASFGLGDLDGYSKKLIRYSSTLINKFKVVSVREDTGVDICLENFGIRAVQHVDPTMLLTKNEYIRLIETGISSQNKSSGSLFVYILDKNIKKSQIIEVISKKMSLNPFEIMPRRANSRKDFLNNPNSYALPPIQQWLRGFMESDFIVSDSFHGTVFSIIFNKPFIAIGNNERGLARFESLLKLFALENRLVSKVEDINDGLLNQIIDWKKINLKLKREQARSFEYLEKSIYQ